MLQPEHKSICRVCYGTGKVFVEGTAGAKGKITCPNCHGKGTVVKVKGYMVKG